MFDKHTHTLIAQRLDQAEKQREQIRAISLDYPEITIEDAYAVQREWVRLKIAEGRTLKGHKIGLTSKAMQASSQISEPDYGALLDDMFFHDGSDIPTVTFSAVINKSSFQTRFNAGDFTFVDVCLFLLVPWTFDIQVIQTLPIYKGNAQLFLLSCVD